MCTDRRDFLRSTAGIVGATLVGSKFALAGTTDMDATQQQQEVPDLISRLPKMTAGIVPITDDERQVRIEKAQALMAEHHIDAVYIEPGSSMFYYTGMRWSTSERMLALVIPQRGELAWVCPKFEEERARELIKFGKDIRTWEEDESPYRRVAEIFRDRGIVTVAETILEGQFHPPVLAGVERQDGGSAPRFQAEPEVPQQGRQGAELIVHGDAKRLENAANRIIGGTAGMAGKLREGGIHDFRKRSGRRERRSPVSAHDLARKFAGTRFI